MQGNPLTVVERQRTEHQRGLLAQRQHTRFFCAYGPARAAVGVQNAAGVIARLVDAAVESQAGRVDREWRLMKLVALLVDEHQAGRGDFVENQLIRVDQERVRRARDARA